MQSGSPNSTTSNNIDPATIQKMMAMMGAGGAAGGLWSLFNGNKNNPADAAMPYYNQIPGELKDSFQPYMDAGKNSLSDLTSQYKDLLSDPGSVLARIGSGYQKSPGFEFQKSQGLQGINNAAAAGGMLGTSQHQQDAGTLSNNLANQDYGQYLQRALGLWGQGLSGEENLEKGGQNAASQYGGDLAQALMSEGNLAYGGQQNKNASEGNAFSQIASGAAGIIPYLKNFLG